MLKSRTLFWLSAVGVIVAAPAPAFAGDSKMPSWCRTVGGCVVKGGVWVAKEAAGNAAGQAVLRGAANAGRRARDAVNRERLCQNTQGGNNANSTAAVRTC